MATGLRPLPTGVAGESNIESVKQGLIAVNMTRNATTTLGYPDQLAETKTDKTIEFVP